MFLIHFVYQWNIVESLIAETQFVKSPYIVTEVFKTKHVVCVMVNEYF